jgi:hypothetical protein
LGIIEPEVNTWGIPAGIEREVRQRDKACVYCGVHMKESRTSRGSRKAVATWEHIINDASIITRDNIALCCAACNSSKGAKTLLIWLKSTYCISLGINERTVANVVKKALMRAACDRA